MDIKKVLFDLRAKGLQDEEILTSLQKLAAEEKITNEDLAEATEILKQEKEANDERALASKLLGVKL